MKKKFTLDIKTHYKPTETFQYTHFTSGHPPGVKKGFIKGEAILGDPGADSWVTRKSRRPSLMLHNLLRRADETQQGRNSCPRLQFLASVWTLSCRCPVKFFAKYQPCIIVYQSFYFWLITSFTDPTYTGSIFVCSPLCSPTNCLIARSPFIYLPLHTTLR